MSEFVQAKLRPETLQLIQLIAAELAIAGTLRGTNRATGRPSVDQVVDKLARQWWNHRERGRRHRRKKAEAK